MAKKNESNVKIKKLEEQLLLHDKKNEIIEQLIKDYDLIPERDIISEEGKFYIVDGYREKWWVDIELRKRLINSYFYSPVYDGGIYGYDPLTGGIIYDLWHVGKVRMSIVEGINSDFHDTGYGIGKLLFEFENTDFNRKVPPTYILPAHFINYHSDLQSSLNEWGIDIELLKINISKIEQRRFHLSEQIYYYEHLLENSTDKSDDFLDTYKKILDDLIQEYDALG